MKFGWHWPSSKPKPKPKPKPVIIPSIFTQPLTWTCHGCGEERPDAQINIYKSHHRINGSQYDRNWRYCRDRPACLGLVTAEALGRADWVGSTGS